ncbi:type IV secretion system protein [Vibrio tubiashii]|uniref:Conjugal transfer protein TraA n=1 Tax=Vibrio tubiashii ATCC 19109 TaxID=1051646 RepID=F9T6N4_9VIBR|nr:type IV secretion system protein [Vibrio tubiashii]AIW17510.1 conjugal transfer protein TrbL [Vibrio tubiashii ATCC 19109]EGU54439.1 conjugal transfer protein TraA [Vibrio tubiashii ATCC 19109]EIF01281.1 conjugal transfer protein TraA [Vibrio tubiashii NCIMB 1337 = ATCC 19106]
MFETLFNFLDEVITKNISEMVVVFAQMLSPFMGVLVVTFFCYMGYQSLYDGQKDIYKEYFKAIISLALCAFVAFNTEWYQANVVPIVLYMGDDFAVGLLGAEAGSSAAALQAITNSMLEQNGMIWDTIDVSVTDGDSIVHFFLATGLIIISFMGFLPFIGISTAYLMVAKIMVSFLLVLAPLYVMFGFFPATRSMFKSWTGQALNYVLLSVIYPIAFNLFLQLIQVAGLDGNITATSVLLTFIIMFALILLATQIPTFTSALSGGIGINGLVGGIGATADSALNTMGNIYKGGEKGVGLAKQAKQWAADKGKGNISPG